MADWSRRRVLRGVMNGGAIAVGLPLLNCFLNGNGTALASGLPIPVRFGTWFWGCGMSEKVFIPKTTGADFVLPPEVQALEPVRKHINMLTNFAAFRDSNENLCHLTGWIITRAGQAPKSREDRPGETLDVTIANQIGRTRRFKSLTVTATGEPRTTVSYESATSPSMPEYSPTYLYQRIFGEEFQDPNSPTFAPDPKVMARKSVLSAILDETKALQQKVGAEDKARLEQYFTNVRDLEYQLGQQLERPEPIAGCFAPDAITNDLPAGRDADLVAKRHKLMTDLMVMAVACDQTRVFNMAYSAPFSDTIRIGYEKPHHTATHEEGVDEKDGFQHNVSWFTRRAMESWAEFVHAFASFKEGNGSLLDNCLIMANSDHSSARIHSLENLVMMTAGKAGGQLKTGLHVDGGGTTTARLGYTALQLMGVNSKSFGTQSNTTSKEIGEILA